MPKEAHELAASLTAAVVKYLDVEDALDVIGERVKERALLVGGGDADVVKQDLLGMKARMERVDRWIKMSSDSILAMVRVGRLDPKTGMFAAMTIDEALIEHRARAVDSAERN